MIDRNSVPVKNAGTLRQLKLDFGNSPEACREYWGAGAPAICDYAEFVDSMKEKGLTADNVSRLTVADVKSALVARRIEEIRSRGEDAVEVKVADVTAKIYLAFCVQAFIE